MGLIDILSNPGDFKFYWKSQTSAVTFNNVNPREIPFGNDRPGGGNSGQPYIQIPIPGPLKGTSIFSTDFLLRGGINAPLDALTDVKRLTKYFTDKKSPSGLLFTIKQNLLSRVAVKTESARGIGSLIAYAAGTLNEGVYSPLSTIAQAGVGFAGIHLNKQGIDPTGLIPGLHIRKYEKVAERNNSLNSNYVSFNSPISAVVLGNEFANAIAITSKLGTNKPLLENPASSFTKLKSNAGIFDNRLLKIWYDKSIVNPNENNVLSYGGGPGSILGIGRTSIKFADKRINTYNTTDSTYENHKTWTQVNIFNQPRNGNAEITEDFRKLLTPEDAPQNVFLSVSPSYLQNNIEQKFLLGNPGKKGDISSYSKGKATFGARNVNSSVVDKINALPIYRSKDPVGQDLKEDIIDFRIAILDNNTYGEEKFGEAAFYIHFRAFIDSFSDSYDAEWDALSYMGRGEKFYKYGGFKRDININFTVVAQSKFELIPMYKKLNFLASSLTPYYSPQGYMGGNIAKITVGGYVFNQPGIINSISYEIPEDSPWEIGIDENGEKDNDVQQLPHIIKVNMKFTPIHDFRPSIQTIKDPNTTTSLTEENILQDNNIYGNQRFISLDSAQASTSYKNGVPTLIQPGETKPPVKGSDLIAFLENFRKNTIIQ